MRRTPDEPSCDWTRDRLPSLAAGDDLAPGEADAAEAHLARCEPCRTRRDGLARMMDALAAAAAESPVDPDAPSLWPALRARIDAEPGFRSGRSEHRRLAPASPVGILAAAASLVLCVGLPLAWRVREESTARIRTAAAPLPASRSTLSPIDDPSPFEPISSAEAIEPADLALLEAPPLLDPEGKAIEAPRPTPPPATPPAVRFELDRGIPMPPDARIDRPTY